MARLLYRATRGKVVTFFENIGTGFIDNPQAGGMGTSQPISYSAYVLVFANSDYLLEKVTKISQSFSVNSYQMPKGQTNDDRNKQMKELEVEISKASQLLLSTRARLRDYLASVQVVDPANSSVQNSSLNYEHSPLAQFQSETTNQIDLFVLYELFIERESLIFVTLNKFRVEASHLLLGFCWIPSRDVDKVI